MITINLSEEDAQKVVDWLNESFMSLEIGGTHRYAAVRLRDQIENIL